MSAITLRQIEIFHAVMTTGNLTQAARLLKTSQPTVSRELARFEQCLKLQLFDRVHGRLRPTVQGLRLFEEVQRSYYGLEHIINTANGIRQFQQAQLSITCLPVFAQSLLPTLCKSFLDNHPDVSISIIPQESPILDEWLSAQRYDLGLTENPHTPAGTEHLTLMTLNEVCVLPAKHRLLRKQTLTPQDFNGEKFISLSATDRYRQLIDSLFNENQVTRRLIMETHSAASICAMVKQGIGISIVNPLTALDYMDNQLHIRPFSIDIPFTVNVIRPLHRTSSTLVTTFIQHIQKEVIQFAKHLSTLTNNST